MPVQRIDRMMLGMTREEEYHRGCPYFCPARPHACYFDILAMMQSERIRNRLTVVIPREATPQRVLPHPRSVIRGPQGLGAIVRPRPPLYHVQRPVALRREGGRTCANRAPSPIRHHSFREILQAMESQDQQLDSHGNNVPPTPYSDEEWN